MKRVLMMVGAATGFLCAFGVPGPATAVPATGVPAPVNYQGVLRDAGNQPLEGLYDMVFRFFDAAAGGNEILVDSHQASGAGAVAVSRGLFNVAIGTGSVTDGSGTGPGDPYSTMSEVFRDYVDVWLEVEVGGETLAPRTPIRSAAYAHNSGQFGGLMPSAFGRLSLENLWSGPNTFDRLPTGSGIGDGGLYLNPANAAADATLMGVAVSGSPKLRLDADGDLSVNRYVVGQSLYGKAASPWLALEDAAGTNLLTTLQAFDAFQSMYLDDHQNGRTVLFSGVGGIGLGTTSADPAYSVTTPSLKVQGSHFVGGALEVDTSGINIDGGTLRLRSPAETLLFALASSDSSNYSYLYDYQNGRYLLYTNANGIGIGTTAPINSYAVTMPSLYLPAGTTYGILAEGASGGGAFQDGNQSGFGRVGYANYGGWFQGTDAGSYIIDSDSSGNALVGTSTYKILGTGAVSFVQNHPAESDKVIVYAAPEGDEVATYTRGSARLEDGVARVALGETFKWVTNPDLGLTASLTPRGGWSDLYVESVTTSEIVVRSAGGAPDASFDYLVFGLRIGFEESSIVQEKTTEARIPSMADHRGRYERLPDLRRFNALERFKTMEPAAALSRANGLDVSASQALREAVGEFDPRRHALPIPDAGGGTEAEIEGVAGSISDDRAAQDVAMAPDAASRTHDADGGARSPSRVTAAGPPPLHDPTTAGGRPVTFDSGLVELHSVSEPVEAGDILVADRRASGRLALGRAEADPAVMGIAAGGSLTTPGETALQVAVALAGTTLCKVDASYGAIRPGDLLTASSTPGHAKVAAAASPGTILGKALEPLDAGTGLIRVLVMPR